MAQTRAQRKQRALKMAKHASPRTARYRALITRQLQDDQFNTTMSGMIGGGIVGAATFGVPGALGGMALGAAAGCFARRQSKRRTP